MAHASANGVSIAYDDLGAGDPPLLFLTGWCSSKERWSAVARLCARQRRTLSSEWRGHGASDRRGRLRARGDDRRRARRGGRRGGRGVRPLRRVALGLRGHRAAPSLPRARADARARRLVRHPAAAALPGGARDADVAGRLAGRPRQALRDLARRRRAPRDRRRVRRHARAGRRHVDALGPRDHGGLRPRRQPDRRMGRARPAGAGAARLRAAARARVPRCAGGVRRRSTRGSRCASCPASRTSR